jgi:glutathione peroxidase
MGSRIQSCRFALIVTLLSAVCLATPAETQKKETAKPRKTVYDYSLVDLDGKETPLSSFKGKLLLIVNLASQSVYHDQIDALNELQKTYGDKGLVVIGIPSADFGAEELKDATALRTYYKQTARVNFPIFACASLRGKDEIPLYQFLTDAKASVPGGDIHWNFTKFIVDREGVPLARFEVRENPADVDFHVTIEKALDGKLKKKSEAAKDEKGGDDSDDDDN